MNKVFISYSGDRLERATLVTALKEHGLNPWRDVESLEVGGTSSSIEAEIVACSGALLWVNKAVLASDYVRTVELPALARAWRRAGLRLMPVFDGMSPEDGADAVSQLGIEVGDTNGHLVDPALSPEMTAAQIARRYVEAHVADQEASGAFPIVRLVSCDDTAALRDNAVLNFDWRHALDGDSLATTVEERLKGALAASTAGLKAAYGSADVIVAVKAHLPFAAALGHAFAAPTGCRLVLGGEPGAWVTTPDPADVEGLAEHQGLMGPTKVRRAAIEVSVSRDVEAGVNEVVASGRRYRDRVMLMPADGPGRAVVDSAGTADAWGRQVAEVVTGLVDRGNIEEVDLFLACPVEMAMCTGWWLNAAGRVNLMHWSGKTGPYERMWTLP